MVFTCQTGKPDLAGFVTADAISFHESAGGHLFECEKEVVANERAVLFKDQRTVVNWRERLGGFLFFRVVVAVVLLLFFRRLGRRLEHSLAASLFGVDGGSRERWQGSVGISSEMYSVSCIDHAQTACRVYPVLLASTPTAAG
jgi:hypothetical protein